VKTTRRNEIRTAQIRGAPLCIYEGGERRGTVMLCVGLCQSCSRSMTGKHEISAVDHFVPCWEKRFSKKAGVLTLVLFSPNENVCSVSYS
jgi:hypothetical protein